MFNYYVLRVFKLFGVEFRFEYMPKPLVDRIERIENFLQQNRLEHARINLEWAVLCYGDVPKLTQLEFQLDLQSKEEEEASRVPDERDVANTLAMYTDSIAYFIAYSKDDALALWRDAIDIECAAIISTTREPIDDVPADTLLSTFVDLDGKPADHGIYTTMSASEWALSYGRGYLASNMR